MFEAGWNFWTSSGPIPLVQGDTQSWCPGQVGLLETSKEKTPQPLWSLCRAPAPAQQRNAFDSQGEPLGLQSVSSASHPGSGHHSGHSSISFVLSLQLALQLLSDIYSHIYFCHLRQHLATNCMMQGRKLSQCLHPPKPCYKNSIFCPAPTACSPPETCF